jgi:hypothetical protein
METLLFANRTDVEWDEDTRKEFLADINLEAQVDKDHTHGMISGGDDS